MEEAVVALIHLPSHLLEYYYFAKELWFVDSYDTQVDATNASFEWTVWTSCPVS